MFSRRYTLFRFFGFDIRADMSWFILSLLIIWSVATSVYPYQLPGMEEDVYWQMGWATLLGIFISIIAHEVAHAVVAQRYHMPITGITLFIFGGVAEMKGDPESPKGEFLMAFAGPAMSGIMALFFWSSGVILELIIEPGPVTAVVYYLALINTFITVLNLVPAFPLDGGRMLRGAIWAWKGNIITATRISSELGAVFAYSVIVWGAYRVTQEDFVSGIWWGLIGLFLNAAGSYAFRQTQSRTLLSGQKVRRFMRRDLITVSPDLTVAELVDEYVYNYYHKSFPVIDRGELAGVIALDNIMVIDRRRWPWLRVGSLMRPVSPENTISPESDAAEALDTMRKNNQGRLLVVDQGKLIGVLSLRDLLDYLSITLKLSRTQDVVDDEDFETP